MTSMSLVVGCAVVTNAPPTLASRVSATRRTPDPFTSFWDGQLVGTVVVLPDAVRQAVLAVNPVGRVTVPLLSWLPVNGWLKTVVVASAVAIAPEGALIACSRERTRAVTSNTQP